MRGLFRKPTIAILIGFGLISQGPTWGADEDFWKVAKEDALCFLSHLEAYGASESDPVIVYLQACPIVDRKKALLSIQQNAQLPQISQQPDGELDKVLVYSKNEIECLSGFSILEASEIVLLPQRPACR